MKMHCLTKTLRFFPLIKIITCYFLFLFFTAHPIFAQDEKVVDQIIAVVGGNIILQSELETQYLQAVSQGMEVDENSRCELLEEMLYQKLLLNQAQLDSVKVSDSQVESEMDKRLRYFISQIGSEQKLEEYYGKSIAEIKDEFKELIRNQLLIQSMQSKVTANINVTPSEVKAFYNKRPEDSIPLVNSEIEVAQIVAIPKVSEEAKKEAREKIEALRERIIKGEKFATLAVLYSEDPGSAKKGGELGFVGRGSFVPEFEAMAYQLKEGEVSEIVETQYGFHIMQLIERRGEQINIRHILISPKIAPEDLVKARNYIDSISHLIASTDTLDFAEAAVLFSDDIETKYNGGLIVNPQTGTTRFEADQLDPSLFFTIDKLEVGEMSGPVLIQMPGGKQAYRLLYLKTRTEPHRANLKDDYQKIQETALAEKQQVAVNKWITKKLANIYFKLHEDYKSCNFATFNISALK